MTKDNKNWVMLVVVGMLFLFSVLQAVQVQSVRDDLSGMVVSEPETAGASSPIVAAPPALPAIVPAMVGGC